MRLQLPALAGLTAMGLLLAACGSSSTAAPSAAASVAIPKPAASVAASKPATSAAAGSAAAKPSGAPAPSGVTISITQPKDGSTVPAGDVTVNYDVTGVTLVPAASASKLTDYHIHVLLDVDPTPYLVQFQPFPMGNDYIVHTGAKSVTFKSVAAGSHKLNVSLATSNHISVSPPVQANATFTAQ